LSATLNACVRQGLDHRLNRLLFIDLAKSNRKGVDNERPVSRIALRRILLEGLDHIVHFGSKFVAFEDAPGGAVNARFEDGSNLKFLNECAAIR
jgi:hypothetical protein